MQIRGTAKTTTASAAVAGLLALAAVQSASVAVAGADPARERYAARAGAQVVEVSLLGRDATFGSAVTDSTLEAAAGQLGATATGTGTDLSPATRSVARFGDTAAAGGTKCATPSLGPALDGARGSLAGADARLVPGVEMAPACGAATVTGGPQDFAAESTGGRTQFSVKLPEALRSLVEKATNGLAPQTLATPLGDLVEKVTAGDTEANRAVGALNGILGDLVPGVAVPVMEPHQTVGALLERLGSSDLLRVDLAAASARNAGSAGEYLSEALTEGGVVEVLPGFQGAGAGPLLRMTVGRSRAAVPVARSSMQAAPVVENAVVRVESDLLAKLPFAGPPVVGGLVHGLPLSGLPGGDLPVAGGLLGGGLPLDSLVKGLGLRSGAGYLEVGPGQSLSVLCEGAVAPFCSEVSVSAPKAPVAFPSGTTHAESSTVTVHLFKGLDALAPGTHLATALAQPALGRALEAAAPAGVTLGQATTIPGIRLVTGGVVAEAGGVRDVVARAVAAAPPAPPAPAAPVAATAPVPVRDLPHTGGTPFNPALAPLLAGSAGILAALHRRSRLA